MDFLKQYNSISNSYDQQIEEMNKKSIAEFKEELNFIKSAGGTVVDFGCGSGDLAPYLKQMGYKYSGVDSSEEMISLANKIPDVDVRAEDFTKTSFDSNSFDLLVSKWAIQTTGNIDQVYKEGVRLLKSKGWMVVLVAHPIRQFLEKKKQGKNYFNQETVESVIFNGTIVVKEPSHTISEYVSDYFLKNFSLVRFIESYEFPGAEQINGDIYPTHLIITAQKK